MLTVNLLMQIAVIRLRVHSLLLTLTCREEDSRLRLPTLRLNPGDTLVMNLTNNLQAPFSPAKAKPMHMMHMAHQGPADDCSGNEPLPSSTNMHFHGLNVLPICHQDDVLNTIIESGDPSLPDPDYIANEPPGLYWYHPHIHGITTQQVTGERRARSSWKATTR